MSFPVWLHIVTGGGILGAAAIVLVLLAVVPSVWDRLEGHKQEPPEIELQAMIRRMVRRLPTDWFESINRKANQLTVLPPPRSVVT